MNLEKIEKYLPYIILIVIGAIYIYCAPFTVQSGDTGELVTNAYYLRNSHPPGYPLWTILYHLPVRYLGISTPFFAASLVTIILSLIWMSVISFSFRSIETLLMLCVLGTTVTFWRYSILPDVFNLHLLFLVLVFLVFHNPKLLQKPWLIFLIALSVAHHHTIVFAFPLYLYAVFKGNVKRNLLYSLLFGLSAGSIYFLMMFFHPKELGSWGNINSFQAVVNHFLRTEYGTFKLHNLAVTDLGWLTLLGDVLATNLWSLILVFIYSFWTLRHELLRYLPKLSILAFCILGYLLTFYVSGVMSMDGSGESVFERFLLQPFLMFFFMLLLLKTESGLKYPKWLLVCLLLNIGQNVFENFKINNYSKNTIVEDFIQNNFRLMPQNTVLYTAGDTWGFSAYYVHQIQKIRPDIKHVFHLPSLGWSAEKFHDNYPDAFLNTDKTLITSVNFDKYSLYSNVLPKVVPPYTYQVYQGLLFGLIKSEKKQRPKQFDCEESKKFRWRHRPNLDEFEKFEVSRFYDLKYGDCYFFEGFEHISTQDLSKARVSFEKAVELSPFSTLYVERLCFLYKKMDDPKFSACDQRLEELISSSNRQYYLFKFSD